MKHCFFNFIHFLCLISNECFILKINYMLPKTIACLSMSLVSQKEGWFGFLHFFGVVSCSFQPFLACWSLFRVVWLFKSDGFKKMFWLRNLLWIKFMLEFISKWSSFDVLKNGASVITKRDSFFYLKVWQAVLQRKTGITKWSRSYKVGQLQNVSFPYKTII